MNFEIIVITNTFKDLSNFNFEFVDLKILDIESKEFRQYIHDLNPKFDEQNFSFFQSIINDSRDIKENKRYAIFKRNHKDNFDSRNLYLAYQLLLIIFPSELIIEHSVAYQDEHDFVQRISMSSRQNNYSYEYDYLDFDDEKLPLINEFIELTFERTKNTSYIGLAIENYVNSYTASHLHFQFIAFCMALENIVHGNQELTYRLRRSVAVLCGNDRDACRRIYNNINAIYKVRSKIVHGDKYNLETIEPYLVYLNAIVSLLIIELLVHNIDTNETLGERITEVGFGEREMLSENWKEYALNLLTFNKVRFKTL
jgi:hypothetical protein